jgi:hypothetical protein
MPFVGLMTCVLHVEDEMVLGPITQANGAHPTPWRTVLRSLWTLALGFLLRRHRPNAFFDAKGKLLAEPEVIA